MRAHVQGGAAGLVMRTAGGRGVRPPPPWLTCRTDTSPSKHPPPPPWIPTQGQGDARGSADASFSWQKVQGREANRCRHRLTEPTTKALCQPPPPPLCCILYPPKHKPRFLQKPQCDSTASLFKCALPPVRWLFGLYCARVRRAAGSRNQPNLNRGEGGGGTPRIRPDHVVPRTKTGKKW